jgi:hypothetical protein
LYPSLNLYAACYEMKTKFIIRTEANTAADITSEEGVTFLRARRGVA